METLDMKNLSSIEDIYKTTRINWTNFHAYFNDCQNDSPIKFDVMPEEYLQFAKINLSSKTKQGCIDAMGNAKRAIECQIDILINTLGYDYKKFDLRGTYPEAKAFIKKMYKDEQYSGLTDRVKLLNILELAPSLIISNIRNMRNQMEHEYNVPQYSEVKKAIEVAELFINASNRKFSYAPTILEIANKLSPKEVTRLENYSILMYPFIRIQFVSYWHTDVVTISAIKHSYLSENPKNSVNQCTLLPLVEDSIHIDLNPEDKFYIESIYSILTYDCYLVPQIFNCNVKDENLSYRII